VNESEDQERQIIKKYYERREDEGQESDEGTE